MALRGRWGLGRWSYKGSQWPIKSGVGRTFGQPAGALRLMRGSSAMKRRLPHTEVTGRPMPSPTSSTILGLDLYKNTITAGILRPDHDVAVIEKISSDDDARRLIARLGPPRRLRPCYDVGRMATSCAGYCRRWGWRAK